MSSIPLCDLGRKLERPEANGILVPENFDQIEVSKYIHDAFQKNAKEYVKGHQDIPRHERIYRDILQKVRFNPPESAPFSVLDLCSGAGNSVVPILQMFPRSEVIASDLSIELLCMLRASLEDLGLLNRCAILQLNAEVISFEDECIDVVIANSALHHLIQPLKTIKEAYRVLKKPGLAIIVEPFESGYAILEMLWKSILSDPRAAQDVHPQVKIWLPFLIQDFAVRKGSQEKSGPVYKDMEDKWLFSRAYFEEASESCGFSHCLISLVEPNENPFTAKTKKYLSDWPYEGKLSLPGWAWDILSRFEANFSPETRREFLFECAVVLQKC